MLLDTARSIASSLSGGDYMGDAQIAYFQKALTDQLSSLQSKQQESLDTLRSDPDDRFTDPIDLGTQLQYSEISQSLSGIRTSQINQIKRSLNLIETNDYGFCAACGQEIGLLRLILNPTVIYDVNCAEIHEHRVKANTAGFKG